MDNIFLISTVLLWVIVLVNIVLTLALVRRVNTNGVATPRELNMLKTGDKAPSFQAQTIDGKTLTEKDYAGLEKVMVFVSPGCKPCEAQMPKLQQIYSAMKRSGKELVIVSLASIQETKHYVENINFTAPILAAPYGTNSLNENFKVPGTPSYYYIDAQDKIRAAGMFDHEWDTLVQNLAQ